MIAQALDLVDGLLPYIFLKGNVAWNHIAAEHEFLPHHDAQFIADIVKVAGLVVTASPFTDHIHVRISRILENLAMNLGRDAIGKTVERNYVGAFAEDRNSIDYKLKTLAPLIGNAAQFYRTQARLGLSASGNFLTHTYLRRKAVTAL